jgi:hypothetical protein
MEVTIEVRQVSTPTTTQKEEYRGLWKGYVKVDMPGEPVITNEVYLTLIPSEEERAVIQKFKLADLIIEEVLLYDQNHLEDMQRKMQAEPDPDGKAIWRRAIEEMKNSKTIYRLANYFDNPFVRIFGHPQEAHQYVDDLKQKYLPLIKNNIDHYGARADKETFSL